ncbi:histidine phosphatase family protein [Paenibacillus crassostreae]|uniref:Phosphoglycerate kinase n=1 Tax=Paenibacillus crassostreae TaxID=1763538 RepID=A0A167DKY1_9BACL|nr:histidine phosphatase family protein [Paenibacillus crassostreae]AOZ91331.1 histidine phosphatase family protein [Paenibacillus crassostreae]OAB74510.1 phosphoglycerate kinase [Paenibacillus crassostreae]
MRIGLIRHGVTDWNLVGRIQGQTDIPLNDEGRKQALLLGNRLKDDPDTWDYVISSGLSRADETGSIIASILSLPILESDPRLSERYFGHVEGLTAEQREQTWGKEWDQLDLGQEKDEDIQARGLTFLDDIWKQYHDKNILVISHGAFLAQLYSALFRDKYNERIGNLSLTILEKVDFDWIPLLYNCNRHLYETQA